MTAAHRANAEPQIARDPLREVIALTVSQDSTGTVLGLKLALAEGAAEMVLMAEPVARHLRDTILATLRSRRNRPELPTDASFFARLPAPSDADWVMGTPGVHAAVGCHVETYPDMCVVEFPLRNRAGGPRYAIRPLYAAYLMHALGAGLEALEGETAKREAEGATLH